MPTPPFRSHPTESISLALKCSPDAYPLSALLACCYGHFCISGYLNNKAKFHNGVRCDLAQSVAEFQRQRDGRRYIRCQTSDLSELGEAAASRWFMPPGVSGATNKSERYASNKLNLPRGQRRRHSAESKISHISVDRPEVGVVEEVQEIEPQLQIAGFAEPGKMSILG
jgi:hypothetical protein